PPVTTVSTTSLTVPPSAFFTALKSASSECTRMMRRWEPIGTLSGVSGDGLRLAHTISPTPSSAPATSSAARLGERTAPRARPAEPLGEDPAGEQAQLLEPAGVRERRMAHVVLEVEVRVVDPERAARLERGERELLAVARHQVEPRLEVLEELLEAGRRRLED